MNDERCLVQLYPRESKQSFRRAGQSEYGPHTFVRWAPTNRERPTVPRFRLRRRAVLAGDRFSAFLGTLGGECSPGKSRRRISSSERADGHRRGTSSVLLGYRGSRRAVEILSYFKRHCRQPGRWAPDIVRYLLRCPIRDTPVGYSAIWFTSSISAGKIHNQQRVLSFRKWRGRRFAPGPIAVEHRRGAYENSEFGLTAVQASGARPPVLEPDRCEASTAVVRTRRGSEPSPSLSSS